MGHTLRYETNMERIFLLNLKSELKNFVVVDAQIRQTISYENLNGVLIEESTTLVNTANFTGNSVKWCILFLGVRFMGFT